MNRAEESGEEGDETLESEGLGHGTPPPLSPYPSPVLVPFEIGKDLSL